MKLEQRVQALEQEVQSLQNELQLLKNQIQATLLDIREQLLTNAYPSLRADQLPPAGPPSLAKVVTSARVQPAGESSQAYEEETPAPTVRRVSLNDNGKASAVTATPIIAPPHPNGNNHNQPPSGETDWSNFDQIEEWTLNNLEKLGVARTRRLVELYAEKGRFSPEIRDTLLHFIGVYEDELESAPPTYPAVPNGKGSHQQAVIPSYSSSYVWEDDSWMPEPLTPTDSYPHHSSQSTPSQIPVPEYHPHSSASSALSSSQAQPYLSSAQSTPDSSPNSAASAKTSRSRGKSPASLPASESPAAKLRTLSETDGVEPPRKTVLRLIAGIQNAGAGVNRRKRNG